MSLKLIFSKGYTAEKAFISFFPFPNLLSDHFDEDILTMQYSFLSVYQFHYQITQTVVYYTVMEMCIKSVLLYCDWPFFFSPLLSLKHLDNTNKPGMESLGYNSNNINIKTPDDLNGCIEIIVARRCRV